MAWRKILVLAAALAILAPAALAVARTPLHLEKKNAFSLDFVTHLLQPSDYTDFWPASASDLTGFGAEFAYERKFGSFALEFPIGFTKSAHTQSTSLVAGSISEVEFTNTYFSPSIKLVGALSQRWVGYLGAGPDLFWTLGDHTFRVYDETKFVNSDSFVNVGGHAMAGVEYFLILDPVEKGDFDWPVSITLEYRYTWVEQSNVDESLMNYLNANYGTTYGGHDINVGGHFVNVGLKWHF